jgi:hypothetical protein
VRAESLGEFREARFRRGTPRLGDLANRGRLDGEATVSVEDRDGVELAPGRAHGPLEVRRLGVEHAIELAAEGA